ncbi:MAG: sulfite exporter TauE/SafE family protein [Cyanobacteria bacterium]|jgi:hypothetical protein|nr:sulfite exporter TauE/SafE family protein [Cyanobacteriota bacterium]
MILTVVGHVLAIGIGISLGLMGGGGSILAVPILVYVMGLSSKSAIALSLIVVGTVSLVGVIPHWRQGNVSFKTAAQFIPMAMVGAYGGARLTALPAVTDSFQLLCFGSIMVAASGLMIRNSRQPQALSYAVPPGESVGASALPQPWFAIPAEGLGVGLLTGFIGVGGGFLVIPALVLLGGLPMKQAIGTSLLIIAANSATGFLGYLSQVQVDWGLAVSFTGAASIGTLIGAALTRLIDAKHLQKGFGYFVLVVAIFVLIRH